jgi:hypothetical protein
MVVAEKVPGLNGPTWAWTNVKWAFTRNYSQAYQRELIDRWLDHCEEFMPKELSTEGDENEDKRSKGD